MEQFFLDHQLATLLLTVSLTLFGKYFWDRYLAQSSRITRREFDEALKTLRGECELKRATCFVETKAKNDYIESLISKQAGCLEDAFEDAAISEKRRSQTGHALLCIMMTQLRICEALNASGVLGPKGTLDCSDISKMMVDMGVIE